MHSLKSTRAGVYATASAATVCFALWRGKSVSWDQINYHLYAGFTAFDTRLSTDFFAASIQGYLNRLSFVPFSMLATSGLDSRLMAIVLAVIQSVALWGCYELAVALRARSDGSRAGPILAVCIAAGCPMYFQQVGSSGNDIPIAALILFAWVLMIRANDATRPFRCWAIAGVLLGCAVGLKLTSAIFVLASVPMLVARRCSLSNAVAWSVGIVGAFVATEGWWAILLWREFGSPFFPFFNALFHSPDATAYDFQSRRFLLTGWADLWRQPFRMALPDFDRYVEGSAPDIRYAIAWVLMAGVLARALVGFRHCSATEALERYRIALVMALVFLLCWVAWQLSSGNGRYLVPLGLATGPLIALWLDRLVASRTLKVAGLATLFTAQVAASVMGSTTPRSELNWAGPWLQVELPASMRERPHLIVGGVSQSFSALLPYIHPDSVLINISGQEIIQPHTSGARRLLSAVDRFGGDALYLETNRRGQFNGDVHLYKFGLELDHAACEPIEIAQYHESPLSKSDPDERDRSDLHMTLCPIKRSVAPPLDYPRQVAEVRQIVDAVRTACPAVFDPDEGQIDGGSGNWTVLFANSEAEMVIKDGRIRLSNYRHRVYSSIGTTDEWLAGRGRMNCLQYPQNANYDFRVYFPEREVNQGRP